MGELRRKRMALEALGGETWRREGERGIVTAEGAGVGAATEIETEIGDTETETGAETDTGGEGVGAGLVTDIDTDTGGAGAGTETGGKIDIQYSTVQYSTIKYNSQALQIQVRIAAGQERLESEPGEWRLGVSNT